MRIDFDDKSYLEFKKISDKVLITIQAKDSTNILKKITNTCEITVEQFKELCYSLLDKDNDQ